MKTLLMPSCRDDPSFDIPMELFVVKLATKPEVAANVNPQVSDKAIDGTADATCSAKLFGEAICLSEEDHGSPMNILG